MCISVSLKKHRASDFTGPLTRQFNGFFSNNFEGSFAITNLQEIKFKNK